MSVRSSFRGLCLVLLAACASGVAAQTGPVDDQQGPIRLRQPAVGAPLKDGTPQPATRDRRELRDRDDQREGAPEAPYVPNEFERFVQSAAGSLTPIRRLGAALLTSSSKESSDGELSPLVPEDYVVTPGDEVLVAFWGSVDADFRLLVDRAGRINIPRVGAVHVAGLRQTELKPAIARRASQVFRNFEVSATVGQIRGARIFVTGAVQRPGTYHLSSMSTAVGALMKAGGPSEAGSFRDIEIRRGSQLIAKLDLYDLLLKGDRTADRILQGGDVVHVGPVGAQVGVIGSVNTEAVVELRPNETVADAIRMAGGFASLADRSRVAIEPLQARGGARTLELQLPQDGARPLAAGDVIRVFSAAASSLPTKDQNRRVRVEGEVHKPGDYILAPNSTIADAIRAAGGLTGQAFVFGTEFNRESVRRIQLENYQRAIRDLETELSRNSATQRAANAEQAAAVAASVSSGNRLIERLKAVQPSGRIVLQLGPEAKELPPLALEDGDRILIPARPSTVGIFGSVFNSGSYLLSAGSRIDDMLQLAGGPTRGADLNSLFVVRLNGSVVSARQNSGWFSGSKIGSTLALPGDTVFVPEELDKSTFMQEAKEWTQILYQFGLGAAALKTIRN